MEYFGFDISDFIPCEICGQRAVDINHIDARKMGGRGNKEAEEESDDIENLMGKCRTHHVKYGDKKEYKTRLKEIHLNYMQTRQPLNIQEI